MELYLTVEVIPITMEVILFEDPGLMDCVCEWDIELHFKVAMVIFSWFVIWETVTLSTCVSAW